MSENLGNYTKYIDSIDVKKDKIDNGINEDRIKSEARKYVESRIKEGINKTELQKLLKDIKQLLERQDIERINLKETLEKEIKKDTKEKLDKEKLIQEAKSTIYEKLGISNNIKSNNPVENFEKGIIDVLIVGNYDLAIEIYNTNGRVLIDALKQLASWEGIKQIAESLKESVIGLFNGNAYDKGKSFAELGLVGTGAFAGLKIAKFGVKGLKHIPKNIPSENIVYNPIVKHTVKETKSKIDGIIPREKKGLESNLANEIVSDIKKENLKTLELIGSKEYFNKELKGLSDELGLKTPINVENYIDNGANGAIFEIPGTNMVVKIPREDFKGDISVEINKHIEIYNIYREWKNKAVVEYGRNLSDKIKIPRVENKGGYYTMENLKDFTSLETYLSREILKNELEGKINGINLESLNFEELNNLRQKLGLDEFDYNNIKLGLINSEDFEIVKNFFSYMNYSGLAHGDIHIGNVMIDKNIINNGNGLYAIDFGTFGETGFRDKITDRETLSLKSIDKTISKTNRDEIFDFEYPDLVRIEKIFKNLQK